MDITLLKSGTLKAWVPFIRGTRILVRHVDRDEFKALLDAATKQELVANEMKETFDNGRFNDDICLAAVIGLEGFEEEGAPIAFTPELVKLLTRKSVQFVTTVRAVCTDLDRLYTLDAEQTKKK